MTTTESKHDDTGEHAQSAPCRTHEGHVHRHGPQCGHAALKHGDHVDYEHDGHFHRNHDGHVDECEGPLAAGARAAST